MNTSEFDNFVRIFVAEATAKIALYEVFKGETAKVFLLNPSTQPSIGALTMRPDVGHTLCKQLNADMNQGIVREGQELEDYAKEFIKTAEQQANQFTISKSETGYCRVALWKNRDEVPMRYTIAKSLCATLNKQLAEGDSS